MKIFFVFLRPASQYLLLANLYPLLPSNAVLNLSFLTSSFACRVDPENHVADLQFPSEGKFNPLFCIYTRSVDDINDPSSVKHLLI